MQLKPGLRLKSTVCDGEFMLIKVGDSEDLTCGGQPLSADDAARVEGDADHMNGCVIGKRYVNEENSVEVLCVKSGDGSLYYDGAELMTKDTKKLPSSD